MSTTLSQGVPDIIVDVLAEGTVLPIFVHPGAPLHLVRAGFESALTQGGRWIGLQIPSAEHVTSVPVDFNARARYLRSAPDLLAREKFELAGALTEMPFNAYEEEGLTLIEALDRCPGVMTLVVKPPTGDSVNEKLQRLRRVAGALGARCKAGVLFVSGELPDYAPALSAVFLNVLYVMPCEPDPGWQTAYSVHATSESVVSCTRTKPHMEQLRWGEGGVIEWITEEFVSADTLSRQIAKLRQQGMTLDEIGRRLEIDKSTVSRRLEGLPGVRVLKRPRAISAAED